jgi:hypothetical protein
VRGTLAMALVTGLGPNSAQDQWFFNLQDNSAKLDGTSNGGPFTVFAQVADSAGLAIMDSIAAQRTLDFSGSLGGDFQNLPVVNVSGNANVEENNLVYIESIDAVAAVGSPDYAVAAAPAQLTIKAGTAGTSVLTVTPSNGYTGALTLACGPLPAGVSCSFAPATLAFAAGSTAAQTSTLTVTTAARTASNDLPGPRSSGALAGLFGLACVAALSFSRARRGLSLTVLSVGFMAAVAGCGGTTSTTAQPAAFNVPIRLTDGSTSHPVGVTVTVN